MVGVRERGVIDKVPPEVSFVIRRLSILLLDDDLPFLESFGDLLRTEGHLVHSVSLGLQAVEAAKRSSFDLSILDFELPDLNGLETFARLQKERPRLPALFVTGNPAKGLEKTVVSAGGLALLRKPVTLERIRITLKLVILATGGGDARGGEGEPSEVH